jgi:hypothetical protein
VAPTRRIDLTAQPDRARVLAAWAAGWCAYVALEASIMATLPDVSGRGALMLVTADHLPLALLTVPLWHLCALMTRRRWPLPLAAAVHVMAACLAFALTKFSYLGTLYLFTGPRVVASILGRTWIYQVITLLFKYATLIGIILLLQGRRRRREAEAAAREAELAAARAQLHPHFVLNALNSIVSLMDVDVALARTMTLRFAELL